MKNEKNIFDNILLEFHSRGILTHLILIGSWCLTIYRTYFNNSPEVPLLRTMDLDFLLPRNINLNFQVDIPQILKEYGFDEVFSHLDGYSKFVHPEIEVEFLTPEFGRGQEKPYYIKSLNISAQGLRYIRLIQDFNITVLYKDIPVKVPEPSAFVLLKYLISTKRKESSKKRKDLDTANLLGNFLLNNSNERSKLKIVFNSMPKRWQSKTLTVIKSYSHDLYELLQKK